MKELGWFEMLTHPLYMIPAVLISIWCLCLTLVIIPSIGVGNTLFSLLLCFISIIMFLVLGFLFILYCLGMATCKTKINFENTNAPSPLVIDTLNVGPSFGKISMSFAPGRKSKHESRILGDDLEVLRDAGVHTVVSLLEDWELSRSTTQHGLNNPHPESFGDVVEQKSMQWIHCSIRDKWVPSNTCEFISNVVEPVVKLLIENKNVHIHCHGGKGRTGTLVAAVLLSLNRDKASTLSSVVKEMRGCRSGMLKNPLHHCYLYWLLCHRITTKR